MPNSPTRRFENCMPPKKFAWRFDSINSAESRTATQQKTSNSSPVREEKNKMGLMIDEDMKSKPRAEQSPHTQKPHSPIPQSSFEDTPLDFSVRNHVRNSSNGLHNSIDNKPLKDEELKHPFHASGYSDYMNRVHNGPLMAFPGFANGRNSPQFGSNGRNCLPGKNAWQKYDSRSHNGNQSSMNNGEDPGESRIVGVNRELNGGTTSDRNSPERELSRENSPVSKRSILEGMLSQEQANVNKISSKIQNFHISPTSESHTAGSASDLVNRVSPIMAAANQQIFPHLLPPVNNLVPLPMSALPFINGMNYARPPGLSGSLLSQASEATVLAMTQRRARRRKSDERPFKSYPIDVLEEKLQSVNAFGYGIDYKKPVMSNGIASRSPPSDLDTSATMSESPEHTNGTMNSNNSRPTTNGTDNPSNANFSGDSNESLPVSRTETAEATSCTNGRKRKSTADGDKDEAYWDRRRKNNLAAKRSREARRRKEDAIANMAIIYETQNIELQQSVATLTYKLNESNTQLARLMREHESVTIQNNILQERLSQKRCGHCGSQLPSIA